MIFVLKANVEGMNGHNEMAQLKSNFPIMIDISKTFFYRSVFYCFS